MQSKPASTVLAAALAANPGELKQMWHLMGEELSRVQFAYLVSHFLGRNQKELLGLLETFSQQQLLGGLAELFSEAVVSQPDKSIVSWRSFSQALVSSTLAAGRPPRIATDARVTLARVAIHQGSNAGGSRGGSSGAGDGGSSQGSAASLTISEEHAVFHLPPPLDRLLVCERMDSKAKAGGGGGGGGGSSSSGPTRYRISLWQHLTTKTTRGDSSTEGSRKGGAATGFVFGAAPYGDSRVECANVLLEHGPMVDCTCLVPTLPASSRSGAGGRELSVAALSTGLSIVSGSSSQRALSVWVLSTPPGGGNRYRLDETLSMGTPAPISSLSHTRSPAGQSILFGGTSTGQILCWDAASWALMRTYGAHTHAVSGVLSLPSLDLFAASYADGSVRLWPSYVPGVPAHVEVRLDKYAQLLGGRHSGAGGSASAASANASGSSPLRGVAGLSFVEDRQHLLVATGRRVVVWNPTLCERVNSFSHNDTLIAVHPLQDLIISADISGVVHMTDADCFERLQTLKLCDGALPIGVAPQLHRVFVQVKDEALVRARAPRASNLNPVDETCGRYPHDTCWPASASRPCLTSWPINSLPAHPLPLCASPSLALPAPCDSSSVPPVRCTFLHASWERLQMMRLQRAPQR